MGTNYTYYSYRFVNFVVLFPRRSHPYLKVLPTVAGTSFGRKRSGVRGKALQIIKIKKLKIFSIFWNKYILLYYFFIQLFPAFAGTSFSRPEGDSFQSHHRHFFQSLCGLRQSFRSSPTLRESANILTLLQIKNTRFFKRVLYYFYIIFSLS